MHTLFNQLESKINLRGFGLGLGLGLAPVIGSECDGERREENTTVSNTIGMSFLSRADIVL